MRSCGAPVESNQNHKGIPNHSHSRSRSGNLAVAQSGDPVWDAYCCRNAKILNLNRGAQLPYEVQIPRGRIKIRKQRPKSLMENLIEADYTNIWPCTNQGTVSNFDYDCCNCCYNCPESHEAVQETEAYNLREAPLIRPICDFRWCKKTLPKNHMTDRQLDGLLAQYLDIKKKDCCPPCEFECRSRVPCPPPPPPVVLVPKDSGADHDKIVRSPKPSKSEQPDKDKSVSRCKQNNQCYLEEINIISKTLGLLWQAVVSVFPFLAPCHE